MTGITIKTMKKKAILSLVIASTLVFGAFMPVYKVSAQTIDLSQFRALVQLLIAIGAIPADKVEIARNFVGISTSTPVVTATSTPIFGVSGSMAGGSNTVESPVVGGVSQATTTPVDFNKGLADRRHQCEAVHVLDNDWLATANGNSVQAYQAAEATFGQDEYLNHGVNTECKWTNNPLFQAGCQRFLVQNTTWLSCMNN